MFKWQKSLNELSVLQKNLIITVVFEKGHVTSVAIYKGADKSLARPGRKQATATENFEVHISYLLS